MAKEKIKNNKEKKPAGDGKISRFLKDERTAFISGIIILLIAGFLGIAFISFIFSVCGGDQAAIEHKKLGELVQPNNGIQNWMGYYGAYFAELFINRWLGISTFLFIYLLLNLGYKLVNRESISHIPSLFTKCALWCIWFSIFFGFFFIDFYGESFIYLGGRHGYDLTRLLEANIGWGGTLLFIIASFIILSIFVFQSTIKRTRQIINLWPRLKAYRRSRRAAAAARAAEMAAIAAAKEAEMAAREESLPQENTAPEPIPVNEVNIVINDTPIQDSPLDGEEQPETYIEDNTQEEKVNEDEEEYIYPFNDPAEEMDITDNEEFKPSPTPSKNDETSEKRNETDTTDDEDPISEETFKVETKSVETVDAPIILEDYDPTADLSHYRFPTFDLLKQYNTEIPIDMNEQNENKEKIKNTLADYGIEIQSISATVGPTITLFEIVLQAGTKIARVRNLQDEIAMSIAASHGVRIIAPIPGKSAIGIEVPNHDPQTVSMHSVITSRTFQESNYELPVALGKTITNEVFTFDLAKMPHLLVAGATGQGKSVGLNAILTSLLYKKHPSQLKLVLVDPKQVEFSIYSRIEKHFLAKLPDEEEPIITDVTKVVSTLNAICIEMEDRYALLKDAGLRNIKEYNAKFIHRELNPRKSVFAPGGSKEALHHHYLPYMVVIVDEYGDLIMTAGKEIELPIARIAQKARAVGIHMIIATQRPSAKIITGIIKANFPARMAFRVGQSIDSTIILDQPGANRLIGRGDLLFSTGNNLTRVQCAFVDTPEVDRINKYIAEQQGYPTACILPEPPLSEGSGESSSAASVDMNHLDPLFNEAAEMVVSTGQGSTSMIQRKFRIGYNRAGSLMDQLEAAGIVGPYEGSKARSVLVGDEIELRQVLDNLNRK